MTSTSENNKRIAKNTILLYFRMGITMAVQLYTSRVVLDVLGIEDYGIWSLVATLVVSISFFTGPLLSSTQRFISYEIGKGNENRVQIIFSQSMILFLIFSVILAIIFETLGLWLLNTKLSIPPEKVRITNIVYQLAVLTFIVTLIRMSYDALIIAYEKMLFYAYICLIDVGLKLGIVYVLYLKPQIPTLILYGILMFLVSVIITLIYKIYCNHFYRNSKIKFKINRPIIKEMASFSGWSLMGAFAVMTANQGVSMVLNVFYGVTINATMGITNQIGNAVNQFATNFQVAFQPQIVKLYSQQDLKNLYLLIYRTSRMSFLLLFAIAYPIISNINEILLIWLGKDVPILTSEFCIWLIISLLIDCISAPLWIATQAVGRIRNYQIIISSIILLNILVSYILLYKGLPPVTVMILKCAVSILCLTTRLQFCKKQINFSFVEYLKKVLSPIILTVLSSLVIIFPFTNLTISNTLAKLIFHLALFLFAYIPAVYIFGIKSSERIAIKHFIRAKIHQKQTTNEN